MSAHRRTVQTVWHERSTLRERQNFVVVTAFSPTLFVLTAAFGATIGIRCTSLRYVLFLNMNSSISLTSAQRWTGSYFRRTTLKSLGLCIQLGHVSMRCINSIACPVNFRILHTNGIHDVSINYCGCEGAPAKHQQLLRCGFYPATQINVKTCASFQLLELLHLLALTSKASTYDFYWALKKATNNTGLHNSKSTSRYRGLLRMSLQWRHLKMLKRGGRGHDPSGVAGTQHGELAIVCPSCPIPGINLPSDWEDASKDTTGYVEFF